MILPGSPEYEAARKPAMPAFHGIRPQAIVRCRTPEDVAATLAHARERAIPVAPRSGGHCAAGRSSTDGIVLDVSPMSSVEVDGDRATIGAGTRLQAVYDGLDRHGVAIPAGCGPTVGIAGLTLGGGIGVLGRKYGLTCDRLRAARVVLADGCVVDCDAQREPDLFWALRGAGGGQFGVVTSLVFETVPAEPATAFHLTWPLAAAADVIEAWQEWAPDAPGEIAASLRVTSEAVNAFGLARRVEALPEPATAGYRDAPFRAAKQSLIGVGDVEPIGRPVSKSDLFTRPLPRDAIDALLAVPCELNFTPLGGAYGAVASDATAYAHRDARFMLEYVGERERVRDAWDIAHPHATGAVYPNFPDPDVADPGRAYHGGNLERLLRVKAHYDPDGFFPFYASA